LKWLSHLIKGRCRGCRPDHEPAAVCRLGGIFITSAQPDPDRAAHGGHILHFAADKARDIAGWIYRFALFAVIFGGYFREQRLFWLAGDVILLWRWVSDIPDRR